MASEWPIKSIAECASNDQYATQIGPFGKALMASEYTDSGVPVLRGVNVNQGRFHDDNFVFINEETANRLAKYESFPGDVLLVHKGTIGQIGLMPKNRKYSRYIMGNSMLRVQCDPNKLLPAYLYYWLSSEHGLHYLTSRLSQVGVPQIQRPLTTLREAELPVPPVDEQDRITDILGTLDDKIELNRQMNRTLEATARAIFKAWFVDFEPVKAKATGATSFRGMPQAVFDQLPDRFIDTELGEVPEGWAVKPLGDDLNVTMGQSPPSEYYNEQGEGLPFHQGARDYGFRFPTHRISCTLESRLADQDDVLISVRAPVGRINVADRRMVIGRGLAAAKHPEGNSSYALYLLKHLFAVEDAVGDGTIYKAITKKYLLGMPVVSPPKGIVAECEKLLKPLDSLVRSNEETSQSLGAIRDTLLPKLISGEMRVPVAEETTDGS